MAEIDNSNDFANTPRFAGIEEDRMNMNASGSSSNFASMIESFMDTSWRQMQPMITNVRSQVTANPWLGVGVAAGVFFGVGYLLGRRFTSSSMIPNRNYEGYADYYGSSVGTSNTVGSNVGVGVAGDMNRSTDRSASENLTMSPSY